MFFQIKSLILWPHNKSFQPRVLPFELGKVNVISGASRTGKSAVIPIIDYCLAARTCSIPVKTIRDACSWFGIIVRTETGEMLLARQEPGKNRVTENMFLLKARTIPENPPPDPVKNVNAAQIRHLLDEISGLSDLNFSTENAYSSFDSRVSFRDLAAFVFQPQNVIANPEVMFFKTDRYEHREKLRRIFPYVLNAVTPELLAQQHELNRLNLEFRHKDAELKNAETVSAEWIGELRSKVSEARELGLLSKSKCIDEKREEMLTLLQEVVNRTDITLAVSEGTISEAVKEFSELEIEEGDVSRELTNLRRRLTEMTRVKESASNYNEALCIQRDRLKVSEWIARHRQGDEACPLCGGNLEASGEKLGQLTAALKALEEEADDSFQIPAAFNREMIHVKAELTEASEKLKAIWIRKNALKERSTEASARQYQAKNVERFIGNLENALRLYKRLGEDAGLRAEVEHLRGKIRDLEEKLKEQDVDAHTRQALNAVNEYGAQLVGLLDCERPKDKMSLDIKDLTVKVTGNEREDYLSEIGSGSNWLSYHIAAFLALQQFFLSLRHSPVPGIVVLDQPSQVYFPKRLVVREEERPDEPQFGDEDITAVRKVYAAMANVVTAAQGKLQIIVLDHAPSDVWGNIPDIVSGEEWRGGNKLVPTEWLHE